MHDPIECTSTEWPVIAKKPRRKSDFVITDQHSKNADHGRKRSKTFSHYPRKILDRLSNSCIERCFVAQFNLPNRHLADDQLVCLKSYHITRWSLCGVILVRNVTYEKRVCVRYTLDDWKTHLDVEARFLNADLVNGEDVFQFRLDFPFRLPTGTRLQLALAYELTSDSTVHWDNNDGSNYIFAYSFLQY